jgi:predicted transcriptional regulator
MRKRDSLEIIAQILSLCREPRVKTQVMYGANLSWRMMGKYLSLLRSTELLEIHHSPTKYLTTQKGREFLKRWKELTKLI